MDLGTILQRLARGMYPDAAAVLRGALLPCVPKRCFFVKR
jgi:hypothetical protein